MDGGLARGYVFGAWDCDGGFGDEVAGGLDEDLAAAGVKLGGADGGVVQGDDLRAGEVVAALKAGRKLDGQTAVRFGDEPLRAPLVLGLVVSLIPDLEPAIADS